MQKKIYVAGMFDDATAKKVDTAVRGVSGVTNVAANTAKAQVLVDFNDGTSEDAIDSAIKSTGVDVLN
ncbi:MAG: cation transporter [Treponema sp.]